MPKNLGKRLLTYAVSLSEQGGLEESLFNSCKAHAKYKGSLYIICEMLRWLNMECRFDSDLEDAEGAPSYEAEDKGVVSFTFARESDEGEKEQMFDLKTEKILAGLQKMIFARIGTSYYLFEYASVSPSMMPLKNV